MSRKNQAIEEPRVGMVIREDDSRVPDYYTKRIVEVHDDYVICKAGSRSRVSRKRLAEGRYVLVRDPS